MAEGLAGLDPGRVAGRTEDRDPGLSERVRDAGRQRRLGPDHDELGSHLAGRRDDCRRNLRIDPGQAADPRLGADRGAARGDRDLVDPWLGGQLPGERMLASAAAEDQDPRRHHRQAHLPDAAAGREPVAGPASNDPGTAGRWRIGR